MKRSPPRRTKCWCVILALTKTEHKFRTNPMDILEKIFGNAAKVKIIRLFLFNPNKPFDLDQVVNRSRISAQAARLNIRLLESVNLLKSRAFTRDVKVVKYENDPNNGKNGKNGNGKNSKNSSKNGRGTGKGGKNGNKNGKKGKGNKDPFAGKIKKVEIVKKRVQGWTLNDDFLYLDALQSFLIHVSPLQDNAIVRKLNRVGKIRLLIIAGVFIQDKDSRVDLLLVGDNLRRGSIDTIIKEMEAELGRDLTYSVFETKDFQYRMGMYDKLIRDILDYPHKKLVNKILF